MLDQRVSLAGRAEAGLEHARRPCAPNPISCEARPVA